MPTVYTAGYSGHTLAQLVAASKRLNAVVLDIRLVPQSRWQPQWRQLSLGATLGDRYHHVHALGNKRYKDGPPVELVDVTAGIYDVKEYLDFGVSVILLCGCKDFDTCHRATVARELATAGIASEELIWSVSTSAMPTESVVG